MNSKKYDRLKKKNYEEQEERPYPPRPQKNNRRNFDRAQNRNFPKRPNAPDLGNLMKNLIRGVTEVHSKKDDYFGQDEKHQEVKSNYSHQLQKPQTHRHQNQQLRNRLDEQIDRYQGILPQGNQRRTEIKEQESAQENSWGEQSDKEDKNTSQTNKKQECIELKEDEFPNIQRNEGREPRRGRTNREGAKKMPERKTQVKKQKDMPCVRKNEDKILDFSSDNQDIQDNHTSSLNPKLASDKQDVSLTNLLNHDQSYIEPDPPKEQVKLSPSTQVIEAALKENSGPNKVQLHLVFESEVNILEFRVKEVELDAIGVIATLTQNGQVKLKKYPDVSSELLNNYITVKETSHFFPNMPHAPQQGILRNPLTVQEDHQPIIFPRTELELCKISTNQSKESKNLLTVKLLVVKCMSCQKNNEVVVPISNELACSCHSCSAKILGRIVEVRMEQ